MKPSANRQAGVDVFRELADGCRELLHAMEGTHNHLQSPNLSLDREHIEEGRRVLLGVASNLLGMLPGFAEKVDACAAFMESMTDEQFNHPGE